MTSLDPGDDEDGGGGGKRKFDAADLATATLRRSSRRKAVRSTEPSLSAALTGPGREGACGWFARSRQWRVANPRRGVIIQKVTREFDVESYDDASGTWSTLSGTALDAYVTDPDSSVCATDEEYWEVWKVRADGRVEQNIDTFGLCSLIPDKTAANFANTTRGSFTMTGVAAFYPTSDEPDELGFTEGAVEAAGELLSTTTDPTGGLTASPGTVTFTVTVTWDSTSTVTPAPATPDAAYSVVTVS